MDSERRRGRLGAALVLWLGALLASSDTPRAELTTSCAPLAPRNVVLMIGDGMGIGPISGARVLRPELTLLQLPETGLMFTAPWGSNLVTDSAAAATALATGVRTYNGAVALDPQGDVPVETVLELAERLGLRTGLVATSSVTHATPASFAAHATSRTETESIAAQMAASGVDVLIGGGLRDFQSKIRGGSRKDGRDLLTEMRRSGYTVATRRGQWERLGADDLPIVALLAADALPPVRERKPTLAELSTAAVRWLSSGGESFLLVIEGSQIDWEGHRMRERKMLEELLDFDDAVSRVLDRLDLADTLLLVTADHDTGGWAPTGGSEVTREVEGSFLPSGGHTGELVPLFATGTGAGCFRGTHDIDAVGRRLRELVERGAPTQPED